MNKQMINKSVAMIVEILIIIIIFMSGFSTAVLYLWNWLMPHLFGLHPLTYWQAVGLLGLCWLLFGGFGWLGGGSARYKRSSSQTTGRLAHMSPEERAKFREALSDRP